jgi:hypothetical protein
VAGRKGAGTDVTNLAVELTDVSVLLTSMAGIFRSLQRMTAEIAGFIKEKTFFRSMTPIVTIISVIFLVWLLQLAETTLVQGG